jgi:Na+/melibiose symporter-like transporter
MWIKDFIRKIYFNNSHLSKKDLYMSRTYSIFEGCTARTIMTLTGGAFLAGFAKYLGASEQVNGIIAAIPALACTAMVLSPLVFERMARRKWLITLCCMIFRLILCSMVFIPVLVSDTTLRLILLAGSYFLAYVLACFVTPPITNWIVNITPEQVRGKYFGIRESYVLAFVTAVSLVLGRVLDVFKLNGHYYEGFEVIFGIAFLLTVINIVVFSSIKEPLVQIEGCPIGIRDVLTLPLKNKGFRKVIVLFVVWNIGVQLSAPFSFVYMVSGLKLSYTYITLMTLLSTATSVLSVRFLGRLADRKSWAYLVKVSVGFQAACHFIWLFVNPHSAAFMVPIASILGGAALGGVNISFFNLQYQYAPEKAKTVYIGFSSGVGGILGFLSALAGSFFIGILNRYDFSLNGFSLGSIQLLFGISCIILFSGVVALNEIFKVNGPPIGQNF